MTSENEADFSEVLKWLEDKIERVEDPEAQLEYSQALDHLGYGIQAEYLEKDSSEYTEEF